METKKWKSAQAYIIVAIILTIFVYIGVDAFSTKPQIRKDLSDVKGQYKELSNFLEIKIPEIDSTFKLQADQIKEQKTQMSELEQTIDKLSK
ncbi:MAG: hypothetical protein GYA51_13835 [Candidatus Methanofastidiosa archaeon]|nr:hypothetical protein [Candidatus Methanofastidiosa archaeon]